MSDQDLVQQFHMRVSLAFLRKVDGWRRQQQDLPGRSEAIRRLVERGLAVEPEEPEEP